MGGNMSTEQSANPGPRKGDPKTFDEKSKVYKFVGKSQVSAIPPLSPTTRKEAHYEPKNILLTGGAGFIGSGVVLYLMKKYPQYKVVVVDKLAYNSNLKNLKKVADNPNFVFEKANLCNFDRIVEILKKHEIETILHFAAESHVDRSFLNSLQFTQNNVIGTHVLLEASRKVTPQIKRFIHVSTDEVYGTCLSNEAAKDENATFEPTNPYAATKAAAEHLVNSYRISYNLPTIITRGSNVYGPRQFPDKMIPKFISILERGGNLPIHGDGQVLRSFIHVEDVASAFDKVLHCANVGDTFNISNGYEATVVQVAKMLLDLFGIKDHEKKLEFTRDRNFNDRRYFISHASLAGMGWESSIEFKEGLRQTVEWYRSNKDHWASDLVEKNLAAHPTFHADDDEDTKFSPFGNHKIETVVMSSHTSQSAC